MNANTIGMLIIMIIYLGAMVLIGILFSRKNNDTSDFYLGGRKLGPIVTAMSAEASDMSSWLLMGLPGVAYLSGCAEAGWTAIGLAIGTGSSSQNVCAAIPTKQIIPLRSHLFLQTATGIKAIPCWQFLPS